VPSQWAACRDQAAVRHEVAVGAGEAVSTFGRQCGADASTALSRNTRLNRMERRSRFVLAGSIFGKAEGTVKHHAGEGARARHRGFPYLHRTRKNKIPGGIAAAAPLYTRLNTVLVRAIPATKE